MGGEDGRGMEKEPLSDEEQWSLHLLKNRCDRFVKKEITQTLELLDEISESDILRGEATILFAVAFGGENDVNESTILSQCSDMDFNALEHG